MNRKILIMAFGAVFMLVAISFATAVSNEKTVDKKASPLFGIRTGMAINEKIKSRFVFGRLFFTRNLHFNGDEYLIRNKLTKMTSDPSIHSCEYQYCSFVPCMNQDNEANVRDLLPCKAGYYSSGPNYTNCI